MKVTKVTANVRFSRAIRYGTYKTVELAAEATVGPKESWEEAQSELYHQLGRQLKKLWVSNNGASEDENEQRYPQEAA